MSLDMFPKIRLHVFKKFCQSLKDKIKRIQDDEKRKKAMVALLVFILAYRRKNCLTEEVYFRGAFSKCSLMILANQLVRGQMTKMPVNM